LLGQVKSRKLKYFGRVTRRNSLEKDIMLGTMPGTRRQGGQRRQWIDNITQWAEMGLVDLVRLADDRERYRRFVFGVAYARLPGTAHYDSYRAMQIYLLNYLLLYNESECLSTGSSHAKGSANVLWQTYSGIIRSVLVSY